MGSTKSMSHETRKPAVPAPTIASASSSTGTIPSSSISRIVNTRIPASRRSDRSRGPRCGRRSGRSCPSAPSARSRRSRSAPDGRIRARRRAACRGCCRWAWSRACSCRRGRRTTEAPVPPRCRAPSGQRPQSSRSRASGRRRGRAAARRRASRPPRARRALRRPRRSRAGSGRGVAGVRGLGDRDGHVPGVSDSIPQALEPLANARDPEGGRSHVHAAATGAEVQRDAHQSDVFGIRPRHRTGGLLLETDVERGDPAREIAIANALEARLGHESASSTARGKAATESGR